MNSTSSIVEHPYVRAHRQIYPLSCIPSAIEMILKSLDIIVENYYELQCKWDNKKGTFNDFHEKTFSKGAKSVTFKHIPAELLPDPIDNRPDRMPTTQELYPIIDKELAAGRNVIVSLKGDANWHIYIVYGKCNDDYLAFTKSYYDKDLMKPHIGSVKSHMEREFKAAIMVYEVTESSRTST